MSTTATASIAEMTASGEKTKQQIAYELVEEIRKLDPNMGVKPAAEQIAETFTDWSASAIAQGHYAYLKAQSGASSSNGSRTGRPRQSTTRQQQLAVTIEVIPTDELSER